MITVFVNLLDGRMDQIDFRIFLGQPNNFLAKLWLVLVVIGSKYDIVSRSERNAVVPLAYEIFASDVFFVPEVTNPRIRERCYDFADGFKRTVINIMKEILAIGCKT